MKAKAKATAAARPKATGSSEKSVRAIASSSAAPNAAMGNQFRLNVRQASRASQPFISHRYDRIGGLLPPAWGVTTGIFKGPSEKSGFRLGPPVPPTFAQLH